MTDEEHRRRVDYRCRAAQARFAEWHNVPPSKFVADMIEVDAFLCDMRLRMWPPKITMPPSVEAWRKLAEELKRKYGGQS